jgi:sugar phosphate isomerase/epimerase
MAGLKIGAFLASFRLGLEGGIAEAAKLGLEGLEISSVCKVDSTDLDLNIELMSDAIISRVRKLMKDNGLEISSTCGDIGGFAHEDRAKVKDVIARSRRIMDITKALGSRIVQTHIGLVPHAPQAVVYRRMQEALEEIGAYGDKIGIVLASETGPESGEDLAAFLATIRAKSIKVNFDPANLVMNRFDHLSAVTALKDYIVHTHAKDGKRGNGEVPLGEGDVDFPRYVAALRKIGFNGYYVIEREVGANPAADIARAKKFLDTL